MSIASPPHPPRHPPTISSPTQQRLGSANSSINASGGSGHFPRRMQLPTMPAAAAEATLSECLQQTEKLMLQTHDTPQRSAGPSSTASTMHHHDAVVSPLSILSLHRQMLLLMEQAVHTSSAASAAASSPSDERDGAAALQRRLQREQRHFELRLVEQQEEIGRGRLEAHALDTLLSLAAAELSQHRIAVAQLVSAQQQQQVQIMQLQIELQSATAAVAAGNSGSLFALAAPPQQPQRQAAAPSVERVLGEKHQPGSDERLLLVVFAGDADASWVAANQFAHDAVVAAFLSASAVEPESTTPIRDALGASAGSLSALDRFGSNAALGIAFGGGGAGNHPPLQQHNGYGSNSTMTLDGVISSPVAQRPSRGGPGPLGATERSFLAEELERIRGEAAADRLSPFDTPPAKNSPHANSNGHGHGVNAYEYLSASASQPRQNSEEQAKAARPAPEQCPVMSDTTNVVVVDVDDSVFDNASVSPVTPPPPARATGEFARQQSRSPPSVAEQPPPAPPREDERESAYQQRKEQLRRMRENAEQQLLDLHAAVDKTTTAPSAAAAASKPFLSPRANEAEQLLNRLRADIEAAERARLERQKRRAGNAAASDAMRPTADEEEL